MSDNFKFVQAQAFILAGAGAVIGDVTVDLSSFTGIDGDLLTMANFGTKGFITLEPNSSSQEEQCSFTGVVQNANGTATLTGISNVLFISPYTETSGFAKSHAGGVKLVITNTSGFYNQFANKNDDELITQTWTFTNPNYPRMDNVFVDPTDPQQLVTKQYADSLAFAGAPNASTSVQGLVQEATTAELNAGTDTGSTGAKLFGSPADFAASIYGLQLPSSGQKDALAGNSGTPSSSNKYVTEAGLLIAVPTATMQMYAGASAPTNWLFCDGTSYLRATYPTLFAIIGTTYGSADGTHFNVPDMRGRVPIGVGTGTGGGASGTGLPTGGSALTAVVAAGWKGEETHALTSGENGAHTHTIFRGGSADTNGTTANNGSPLWGGATANAGITDTSGSGTGHNNIQPVMGVNFIIKT